MPALHSVCPLDCPDRCSLEVRVVDGRVTSITGSRVHPLTDGFICAKVRDFPQRVYGPDRLLHPMRRAGPKGSGRFERVSWDEAVGEIARKFAVILERRGGEAIRAFFYGRATGLLTQGTTDERLFPSIRAARPARPPLAPPPGAGTGAPYRQRTSG